jgi:hypothetical protein
LKVSECLYTGFDLASNAASQKMSSNRKTLAAWINSRHEKHVYERHAYKEHVYKRHAYKKRAYERHTHEKHAREMHAREMHAMKETLMTCTFITCTFTKCMSAINIYSRVIFRWNISRKATRAITCALRPVTY